MANLPTDIQSCKCCVCERILLSRAVYWMLVLKVNFGKSNAGLKNHFGGHRHWNKTESVTNDASGEGVFLIRVICGNHYVCMEVDRFDPDKKCFSTG